MHRLILNLTAYLVIAAHVTAAVIALYIEGVYMPKQNLIMDLYEVTEHAQKVMKDLGITYQVSVPQSSYDCWLFFNCENAPDPLPVFLEKMKGAPQDYVGRGLSQETADLIVEGAKQMNKMEITKTGRVTIEGDDVTIDGFSVETNGTDPDLRDVANLVIDWAVSILQDNKVNRAPIVRYLDEDAK